MNTDEFRERFTEQIRRLYILEIIFYLQSFLPGFCWLNQDGLS